MHLFKFQVPENYSLISLSYYQFNKQTIIIQQI